MYLARTVAPTGSVITLAEAKAQLRVPFSDEDAVISGYIVAATAYLEGMAGPDGLHGSYLGRALLTQTLEYRIDDFPRSQDLTHGRPRDPAIYLPMPPLQSVTSVKYLDGNGVLQTVNPATYLVETALMQGRICLAQAQQWPSDVADQAHAVRITYVAGYGDTAAAVPENIKLAMKMLVGLFYNNRDASDTKGGGFGFALEALLGGARITGF